MREAAFVPLKKARRLPGDGGGLLGLPFPQSSCLRTAPPQVHFLLRPMAWAGDSIPAGRQRKPGAAQAALQAVLGVSEPRALEVRRKRRGQVPLPPRRPVTRHRRLWVQDVSACTVLSEAVYKAVDVGQERALQVGPGCCCLQPASAA